MPLFSLRCSLSGHQGSVYALDYDLESDTLRSAGGDRIVAAWKPDGASDQDGVLLARAADAVYSLAQIGSTLYVGQGAGGIHLINLQARTEERLLQPHEDPVFGIYPREEEGHISFVSGDGTLSRYSIDSHEAISRVRLSEKKLRTLVRHPDQSCDVIACGDGCIVLLENDGMTVRDRIQVCNPEFSINTIAFFPDGKHFICAGRDAMLYTYEWATMKCLDAIPAHNYAVYGIAFDRNGDRFATVSRDKTAKVWDAKTVQVLQRLEGNDGKGHVHSVNALLWLPDGGLATAGDDRVVRIWSES
ncbi:MAG: WD40 repeat domain-containing protein [Bacteroidota bacterium]